MNLSKTNEKIDTLQEELNHANALLGRDGTNTGIPASQTPIGKKKRNNTMKEYLKKGLEDAQKNKDRYTGPEERNVLLRLINYYDNFFSWVTDFELPTTNNLSERSLRSAKVKQRVSGQFDSVKTAGYYADVKTYIETCKRNGINEMIALKRLADGNPYTVSEIFEQRSDCTEAVC